MKVVFLADMIESPASRRRRSFQMSAQWGNSLPLRMALAATPNAPPLGATLICTIARNAGFEAELLECAFRIRQRPRLLELLRKKPGAVCISCTYITDYATLESCVDLVRKHAPGSAVILGGTSVLAKKRLRELGDYCVIGEGEESIVPLLNAIAEGKKGVRIPGVSYRGDDGNIVETPPQLMTSLDVSVFADWSLSGRRNDEYFPIATQRGCLWRCAFCSFPAMEGYKLRLRSVGNVLEEIALNYERHGIYRYLFADSTFTAPPDRCLALVREMKKLPFKCEWIAFARVDTLSKELVDAMADSGCRALFFGLESGDDEILQRMKKGFTTEQVRKGIELVRASGINVTASWVIGWPGETPASVRRTVDFALEVAADQNLMNTFAISHLSPADLVPDHFSLEKKDTASGRGWTHQTMTSRQAHRWMRWATLRLLSAGRTVGTSFDFSWLSAVGLDVRESMELVKNVQAIAVARRLRNHRMDASEGDLEFMERKVVDRSLELLKLAEGHPVYHKAGIVSPEAD